MTGDKHVNAPASFEEAADHLHAVLTGRRWPPSVRWLTSKDLRIKEPHVILRSHDRPGGIELAAQRYAAAIEARSDVTICVPGRTAGLVFSFLTVEQSATKGASQLHVRFWPFDPSKANSWTHRAVYWRRCQ